MNALIVAQALIKESQPMMKKVSNLAIKTNVDYEQAAVLVKGLKEIAKKAKTEEEKITKPLTESLNAAKAHFKPFHDQVKAIEIDTKAKMIAYLDAKEKEEQKLLDKFEAGEIKRVSTLTKKQGELRVESSTAVTRIVDTLVIEDEKAIPREYLIPDETKIKEALKAGKKVRGCKLEKVKQLAI